MLSFIRFRRAPRRRRSASPTALEVLPLGVVGVLLMCPDVATASSEVHVRPARSAQAGTVAVSAFALQGRARRSTDAWSPVRDTYDRTYVRPDRWPLRLAGCNSRIDGVPVADSPLPGPSWRIEPLDGQHPAALDVRARVGRCATTIHLPELGRWRVMLTVRGASGAASSATRDANFRDVVVAAVGDSFASGEGNPDNPAGRLWTDRQCHRSRFAWPARVAEGLENDTTAVTFLSFACSGATSRNVALESYGGIEPSGQRRLLPQVVALGRALGDPLVFDTRTVDVLLGAAGANDAGFGTILERCAKTFTCQRSLSLLGLGGDYDTLDVAMSANLKLGSAYLTGYPERIFTNAWDRYRACDAFFLMNRSDAAWVASIGRQINGILATAGAGNGWKVISTRELFRWHGFCVRETEPIGPAPPADLENRGKGYFHGLGKAEDKQGNNKGTAHPNHRGHNATARAVAPVVRTDVPAPSNERLVLRFLRVRVSDLGRDPRWRGSEARPFDGKVSVGMQWYRNTCGTFNRTITGVRAIRTLPSESETGWTEVTGRCRFHTFTTAGRSFAVRASTKLKQVSYADVQFPSGQKPPKRQNRTYVTRRVHRRSDPWVEDVGGGLRRRVYRQATSHDWGALQVEYEVSVEPVVAGAP